MTARRASSRLRIEYSAPRRIRELLESLGRTEDIRVSPDGRLLAIAGFERNRLAVLGVDIEASTAAGNVAINRIVGISSPSLKRPHGLDFIDDETLLVVNRAGGACVFELPPADGDVQEYELSPVQLVEVGDSHALDSPGAVWISGEGWPAKEVLICNNFANRVTRHSLDRESHTIVGGEVLLQKWLDIPDGVSVSNDRQWIAISNHSTHNVLLFAYSDSLGQDADPDGILRGLHYPHGVRFSPDDRHIFVADAGAPYVHVYARDGLGWGGVRNPVASVRVMDDTRFRRGHVNPEEGGPKGIDIDAGLNVLVVTAECQPLAFFDLTAILENAALGSDVPTCDARVVSLPARSESRLDGPRLRTYLRTQQALHVRFELEAMERAKRVRMRATTATADLSRMRQSRSWRMTAPLRWARAVMQRFRAR